MEAWFYTKIDDKAILCQLCPHNCRLKEGQKGLCRVRQNQAGTLVASNYGKISAKHLDPIEKKPLYHFYPGSHILSIGSVGCNMRCNFCQNCEISQVGVDEYEWIADCQVEDIISEASTTHQNIGIAYTYNEPTIFYEFVFDTSVAAYQHQLKNVIVSNGFISIEPLNQLIPFIDAFNIDLKAFNNYFYKKQTKSQLSPVLNSLERIKTLGKHLEITNLIIPDLNDNEEEFESMVKWIASDLGKDTVLHLSKYFPRYLSEAPATPESAIFQFAELAKIHLDYVYVGNVRGTIDNNTYCPKCKTLAINRNKMNSIVNNLTEDGLCKKCNYQIINIK